MKLLLPLLLSAGTVLAATDNAIPTVFPPERYEALLAKSPFALATPPAPVAAPPEKNFADGWYVSSIAQSDGKDFVSIKSRDLSVQFILDGADQNQNGVALQKVDWNPGLGKTTVTIVKDGQTAKLEFNQDAQGSTSGAPPPTPTQPGMIRPPTPVMGGAPGGVPRPVIPRPMQQPVTQQQPYGQPSTGIPRPGGQPVATPDPRRRIRVINNTPAR